MVVRDLRPGELSWADSFIKDLLTEEEKYQDVIKDLSDEAILNTVKNLDVTSEEFRTGADILGERAFGDLYRADDEARAGADAETTTTIIKTEIIVKEVDDELDKGSFNIDRELDRIRQEIEDANNRQLDELKENNEGFLNGMTSWFGNRFSDLENLLSPLTDLVSDGMALLFALPAQLLFDLFKSFFFEEVKE